LIALVEVSAGDEGNAQRREIALASQSPPLTRGVKRSVFFQRVSSATRQQDGIQHAEHGGATGNPQRQRRHRRQSEARFLRQGAHGTKHGPSTLPLGRKKGTDAFSPEENASVPFLPPFLPR